jgi:hypothetical protein
MILKQEELNQGKFSYGSLGFRIKEQIVQVYKKGSYLAALKINAYVDYDRSQLSYAQTIDEVMLLFQQLECQSFEIKFDGYSKEYVNQLSISFVTDQVDVVQEALKRAEEEADQPELDFIDEELSDTPKDLKDVPEDINERIAYFKNEANLTHEKVLRGEK